MKLLTKAQITKLQKQYATYNEEGMDQMVIAKIFNPYGGGTWYLMNMDPEDGDYLWGIVDLFAVEVGSFLLSELENIRVKPFGLKFERDMYFKPQRASEVYAKLLNGEHV